MVASKFLYDEGEDEEMFSDEWAKAGNPLYTSSWAGFKIKMLLHWSSLVVSLAGGTI